MIKIYTDKSYLIPEYRKIIFPLLFDLCYLNSIELNSEYSVVETIEEAAIFIVPVDISYYFKNNKQQMLVDEIDQAIAKNKIVWVYTGGDFGITLDKEIYTFRLGGFNSKINDKTFILPSFINDPYDSFFLNKKITIAKDNMPSIGFVGNANGSIYKWVKEFFIFFKINFNRAIGITFHDYQSFYPSSTKRFQYLSILQKNPIINTSFIFRKQYRAGAKTEEQKKQTTLDFFENIYNNPYTFCMRGVGNFSVRFFETLALGRIPIVLDTDIQLPLNNIVSWKKHCVVVSEANFEKEIIEFHANLGEKEFQQIQINNRNLWSNYLNRVAYFKTIHTVFKDSIK